MLQPEQALVSKVRSPNSCIQDEPTALDLANRGNIESYLAIKYGITLDQSLGQDYLNSARTVIWDQTTNAAITTTSLVSAVMMITELDQLRSKSVNDNSVVTMEQLTTFSSDPELLIWETTVMAIRKQHQICRVLEGLHAVSPKNGA